MTQDEYAVFQKVVLAVDAILIGLCDGYGSNDWEAMWRDWDIATKDIRTRLQAAKNADEKEQE